MRVVILNTCSTLNKGDTAIVLGQIRLLRRYCPGVHISITSKTPTLDQAFYAPLGVEVLVPFTPALSLYPGVRAKVIGGALALARWEDKRLLLEALQRSDLVLACGGGYFYSYRNLLPGTTFWQNVIQTKLAASLGKPLIFLPQSYGPFASSMARGGVRHLLEERSVLKVFAREENSLQSLYRMLRQEHHSRVALCPDMALYLLENSGQAILKDEFRVGAQPVLAVNLREWTFPGVAGSTSPRKKREEYLNALTEVARFFVQRYRGTVIVVPHALGPDPGEDDRGICLEFSQRIRECLPGPGAIQLLAPGANSLADYVELLSQASVLVGTRLHSCILALLAGVPAISIGYQHKSQGTMDLLGLGRLNVNITSVTPEQLIASVEEIMSHPREIREEIRQRLDHARAWIDAEVGTLLLSFSKTRQV